MAENNTTNSAPALWNPMWAILLSFIFTPVFGGIVCGLNWRAMGKEELSVRSFSFMRSTLFIMVLYIFAEPMLRGIPYTQYVLLAIMVGLWLVWTFTDGIKQLRYVNDTYGEDYEHKMWAKCISWGVGGWVAYYALAITYVIGLHLLGTNL